MICGVFCCGSDLEKIQHLFIACSYTATVWKQIIRLMQCSKNASNFDIKVAAALRMRKKCTVRSKIYNIMFTEIVYNLWIQRNDRVFGAGQKNTEQLCKEIIFKVAVRCSDSKRNLLLM